MLSSCRLTLKLTDTDLDNIDEETEQPGYDHGPGSSDGERESVVEKVGVHQVEKPREALDSSGEYCGLAQPGDCLSLYTVEGGGLHDGQQSRQQGHHAPSHQ